MVGSGGVRSASAGAAVVTIGSVVAMLGTFLPWLRSGARDRSSYAIFDLVERLGFAPGGVVAWSLRLWPLVPLLMVFVAIAGWVVAIDGRGRRALVVVAVAAAVWVGGTAVAVLAAPAAGLFRIGPGPIVTLVGVLVAMCGALVAVRFRRRGSVASAGA